MDVDRIRHVTDKFAAGSRLLDKFGTQWEQIHQMSTNNANKAKIVLTKLNAIEHACEERSINMDNLMTNYKSLSLVEQQIENIGADLGKLENYFMKIEECLLLLRLKRERMLAETFIRNVEGNHEAQVQLEKIQAEVRKDRLMSEHLKRVQDFEKDQQQRLEERRRILEREFEIEKSRYLGKIDSKQTER